MTGTDGQAATKALRTPEQIIAQLDAFPSDLARLVFSDRDAEDLLQPAQDGGWGVVEIIPHLRDWEDIYDDRARRIVEEAQPYLPGFDDTLWAIERDYRGQDPSATLDDFRALRQRLVDYLRSLPPTAWQRTGEHGFYGTITLQWMCDHICDHDLEHARQAQDALVG